MERCSLCPNQNACIPPDNGSRAKGGLLFIGEAPGPTENSWALKHPPGRPFIGRTGEEVNDHYLPLAGLTRSSVTFHNVISCLPLGAKGQLDPKRQADQALLQSCAETRVYPLIESMRPSLIVPLGGFAVRAICPDVDLELAHGYPVQTRWKITAFPMWHPASSLHEPKKMLAVRTDWDRLRRYLRGSLILPHDDYPHPDYAEVTDAREILALDPTSPLAADTESSRDGPFCLTYSQEPGSGRLIQAHRADLLQAFQERLDLWESHILFHHWLYDWQVTEQMGLRFPYHRIVDTMALVYHLGNLPQGLKALAWRELGMEMESFEDVVLPYSTERVLEYYTMAAMEEWPKPEPVLERKPLGGFKVRQPQSMNTKIKRFFTDYRKQGADKDVFQTWENWADAHEMIEAELGPWPGVDIRHVPLPQVIHYACRDSDATLRLLPILRRMRAAVRKAPQESWRNWRD